MAFNPLAILLKENKLVGPNYIDWKRNLDIVLTAKEYKCVLVENLKEMFGDQNCAARQTDMKELMNTIMAEGTPVWDYVLKMIGLLNELKILEAEIHGKTQVDIILQSLPDSFKQFFLNYNMNKLSYSLVELLKEFQVAEGIIRKPTIAFVTDKGSYSRPKGRKKQKKVQKPQGAPPIVRGP
ncbi:uncharacterized protein LOC131148231 [Malania oleifera]|uniref:uncharacterized protein LOC131148231 n=1 Tax=Malania oleifera TaxID=397392 RepID=UPI0025AE8634|nr:uncharacterized protein LOC131148231 [Malania oleifera]